MSADLYLKLTQNAIETSVFIASPILGLGLVAGLSISIFQAATQINDASLAFIPKIVSLVIALMLFGNFMVSRLVLFTQSIYSQIPQLIR
jgi:flagellar biosynthetic protein FliQ